MVTPSTFVDCLTNAMELLPFKRTKTILFIWVLGSLLCAPLTTKTSGLPVSNLVDEGNLKCSGGTQAKENCKKVAKVEKSRTFTANRP